MVNKKNTLMDEYVGLSTDTKPVNGVFNGSSFFELDTGDTYYFDADGAEGSEWVKPGATGSGTD